MITEEKLQQFLDDLRIGKYDSLNYKIECRAWDRSGDITIKDISKNTEVQIAIFKGDTYTYTRKWFLWWSWVKRYDDPYPSQARVGNQYIDISDDLCESFLTFLKEQQEKDKLVKRANIESAFGL